MAELSALAAGAPTAPAVRSRSESRYYVGIGIALLAIVVWGFTRSFYLRPFFAVHHALDLSGTARVPPLVVMHGLLLTAWFGLFAVQVWLAGTRRINVHRQLGIAGAVVAVLLVLSSAATMLYAVPRLDLAHIPRDITVTLVVGNSLALTYFSLLVGTAIWLRRRRPDVHKRLMVLASISILVPALARIGDMLGNPALVIVGGTIALWLSLAVYDFVSRKRLHVASAVGGLLLIIANPLLMTWLIGVSKRHGLVDTLACIANSCS